MSRIIRYLRRVLMWQNTVTEVKFIDGEGVKNYLHVHPAWHSENRIFDDALYAVFGENYERLGKAERSE